MSVDSGAGRLEAKTFSRREIGGYDDVLDFLIGQAIYVDVTRRKRLLAFSTPPFCQEA
ncbi:MAG TPA: hypothetical protein VIH87_08995 [Methylocella sp.]